MFPLKVNIATDTFIINLNIAILTCVIVYHDDDEDYQSL